MTTNDLFIADITKESNGTPRHTFLFLFCI